MALIKDHSTGVVINTLKDFEKLSVAFFQQSPTRGVIGQIKKPASQLNEAIQFQHIAKFYLTYIQNGSVIKTRGETLITILQNKESTNTLSDAPKI